jgi:uncharacterized membrane protein YcfT
MDLWNLIQWPAMAATLGSTWLVGSTIKARRMFGFYTFLVSNALWIVWGWQDGAWALVAGLAAFRLRILLAAAIAAGMVVAYFMVSFALFDLGLLTNMLYPPLAPPLSFASQSMVSGMPRTFIGVRSPAFTVIAGMVPSFEWKRRHTLLRPHLHRYASDFVTCS